jgi:O-antigen/teichoic acid export membrane protein
VGTLVGVRLLTELLSAETYGHVTLLVGASLLAATALVTPLVQATVRFFPDATREGHSGALRRLSIRYLTRSSALSAAALVTGGLVWSSVRDEGPTPWAYAALGAAFLFEARRTLESGLLNAARHQATGALWLAADSWLRPLVAVGLVTLAGASAVPVIVGYAMGTWATNLLFRKWRIVPAGERAEVDRSWNDRMARAYRSFVMPLVPLAFLGWAFSLGDRYILASVAGAGATGLYAAAYPLASRPFLALSGVLVTTLRPVLFEAVSAGDRRRERRLITAWIALVVATGGVGVVCLDRFGPWVVGLTLGERFRAGAEPLLPWIGAAYAIQALQNVFETRIFARKRTASFVVLHVASATVAVVLYFALIPRMGAMGAALGTLGGMSASCVASLFLSRLPERPVVAEGRP